MNIPNPASDPARLRVFVAEFLCGGGMAGTPLAAIPSTLLSEGEQMWRSIVEDFSKWAMVRTPVDTRLDLRYEHAGVEKINIRRCVTPWEQWIQAARDCDVSLVIIPESDGLLSQGIAMLRASKIDVLAPVANAIRVASDKWATAKWLHRAGIAHPETWTLEPGGYAGDSDRRYACSRPRATRRGEMGRIPCADHGYLVKPRDGCGAMHINHFDELEPALASMGPYEITQQRLVGRPASVIVVGNHRTGRGVMLPAVWQSIDERTRGEPSSRNSLPTGELSAASDFAYRGGCGPIAGEMQSRAHALVARTMQMLPGKLSGFIGIDLILGADANQDAVIEINPRLTTSYIGVRRMTDENLTERLFGPATRSPSISVPTESVVWDLAITPPSP